MIWLIRAFFDFLNLFRAFDFMAPLLMRLYLVMPFWIGGWNKLKNIEGTAEFFTKLGIPAPEYMAWAAGGIEAGGAVLLAMGLAVRVITPALMGVMAVAAVTVHLKNGWYAIAQPMLDPDIAERRDVIIETLKAFGDYEWMTAKEKIDISWLPWLNNDADLPDCLSSRILMLNDVDLSHCLSNGVALTNSGIEFAATYFIMCMALFFIGAGRYLSADYWIDREFNKPKAKPGVRERT